MPNYFETQSLNNELIENCYGRNYVRDHLTMLDSHNFLKEYFKFYAGFYSAYHGTLITGSSIFTSNLVPNITSQKGFHWPSRWDIG